MNKNGKTTVAVTRCGSYDEEEVAAAVGEAVALAGGLGRVISPGDRVLLKVNLLAPVAPEAAVTTHPALVKAVIRLVKEAGGAPFVADSPGFLFAGGDTKVLEETGIRRAAEELGVECFQFEHVERPYVETGVPGGVDLDHIYAARLALEADAIITLPKLKTHESTRYTGALKNMFGAVATRTRKRAHRLGTYERFSSALVDIYSVLRPDFAIMDAVVGMEGGGPRHGDPRKVGLVLASPDAVALDEVAAGIAGFAHGDILTTVKATERGLGRGEPGMIETVGESPADVAVEFERPASFKMNLPPFLFRIADRLTRVRPVADEGICDCCENCAKSCPVAAISMDPYPVIDRDRCIECYCCNELCPQGAMKLRRSWLARRLA